MEPDVIDGARPLRRSTGQRAPATSGDGSHSLVQQRRRRTGASMTTRALSSVAPIRIGLRENAGQFGLLVLVNAFAGAMVGMERSILPLIAEDEFHLVARTGILSFILVFGLAKALTNYAAGRFADRYGRRRVLIAGWL